MMQLQIDHFPALSYAANEAVNTLCTNMTFSGDGIRKIMITSCHASEGKTMLSMNIMRTMASLGKRVVLVDDSIVRGTTITRIISLVRAAGAKEVHVMSSAPPFTDACYYGVDVDSKENLIACQCDYDMEKIAKKVGADSVGYLDVNTLHMIIGNKAGEGFCAACFGKGYPTQIPTGQKDRFEEKISKKQEEKAKESYEMYLRV